MFVYVSSRLTYVSTPSAVGRICKKKYYQEVLCMGLISGLAFSVATLLLSYIYVLVLRNDLSLLSLWQCFVACAEHCVVGRKMHSSSSYDRAGASRRS